MDESLNSSTPPTPPIPRRATRETNKDHPIEGNAISAGCIFAAASAFDALNALPSSIAIDVPVSLRASALVLIAIIAAPPVEPDTLFSQRVISVGLLTIVGTLGLHHGELYARIADGLYVLGGSLGAILIYATSSGGPGTHLLDWRGRRENMIALNAALLGYAGIRILRAAYTHPDEVSAFTVTHDDLTLRGLASADDVFVAGLCFGGWICCCASIIILLNHDEIYESGSQSVSSALAQLSVLVFTAAFVCEIAKYTRLEDMNAIFGEESCSGSEEECEAAYRARRFYTSNFSTASVWACAVGMILLAFPRDRRCADRHEYCLQSAEITMQERRAADGSGYVAILAALVALATCILFADPNSVLASVEVLLLYFSIPLAWFGTTPIACALHIAGQFLFTAERLGSPWPFKPTYFTHLVVFTSMALLIVLTISTGITSLFFLLSRKGSVSYVPFAERTSAVTMIMLASLQLVLILCTLGLCSGYDGTAVGDSSEWRMQGFQWSLQHYLSFFFVAAVVGGRFEPQDPNLSRTLLWWFWYAPPVLLGLFWLFSTVFSGEGNPYPAHPAILAIGAVSAAVPWVVTGYTIC